MASAMLRVLAAGALLAVTSRVGAMRASEEEMARLMAGAEEEEAAEALESRGAQAAEVSSAQRANASAVNIKVTKCNFDSKGDVIDCGHGTQCGSGCAQRKELYFAGLNADAACTILPGMPPPCAANAQSLFRKSVMLPNHHSQRWCCLCPLGKSFDTKKGYCVTRDLDMQRLPCSSMPGGCKDKRGQLDLAGSSPEAACRTRNMFVTKCPESARSSDRELVSMPGLFPGQDKVYCCICPENSMYSSAEKACVCRNNQGLERIIAKNGKCAASYDSVIAEVAAGKGSGDFAAPAMNQIENIRGECLKKRLVDEIIDPVQYKSMAVRKSLGKDTALAIERVTVLKLNTLLVFSQEASGVSIDFKEDLVIEIGVGTIHIFKAGQHITLPAPAGGYSAEVAARIRGKELLSMIVEYGTSGKLNTEFDKLKINVASVPVGLTTIVNNFLQKQVLGTVMAQAFSSIGMTARKVSIEGPLAAVLAGRDSYPISVRTQVDPRGCPQEQLCLGLSFEAGQRQKLTTKTLGATFEAMHFQTAVANGVFSFRLTGDAKLDVNAALDEITAKQNQEKFDVAYGVTQPEQKEAPENEADEAKRKAAQQALTAQRKAKLVQDVVCKARLGESNTHKNLVMTAAKLGGSAFRIVMDYGGSAYGLYKSYAGSAPLLLPSEPGQARGDFEALLFTAWQDSLPQQRGAFIRKQKEGKDPTFAVASATTAQIEATGSFKLNKEGSVIKVEGSFDMHSAMIIGMRYDECAPTVHFTRRDQASACWQPKYLKGNDVGLAPTRVDITAEVGEDGSMTACAAVQSLEFISGFGGSADMALSAVSAGLQVKRFLEDYMEAEVGTILYEAILVKQQGRLTSADLGVTLKPDHVHIDIGLKAAWKDIGRLQAKSASEPPKLAAKAPIQHDIGSAWKVLQERMMAHPMNSEVVKPILRQATSKFSYDPSEWLPLGKLSVSSEMVQELDLKGGVDLTGQGVPLTLSGRMRVNLNDVVRSKANEAGVQDMGYLYGAQVVKVSQDGKSWTDMEAVVSCGYLFLSEKEGGPGHFRLTEQGKLRYAYEFDLTKTAETAKRDQSASYVQPDGSSCAKWTQTGLGLKGFVKDGPQIFICIETGTAKVSVANEFIKRDIVNQMITKEGYNQGMLWSQLAPVFKTGPFDWHEGGQGHAETVEESCKDELLRCEQALECMGVEFQEGECHFLSVYDLVDGVKGQCKFKVYQQGKPETWGAR